MALELPDPADPSTAGAAPCDGDCSGRRDFLRDSLGALIALSGLSMLAPFGTLSALEVTASGTVRYPIPAADGTSIDETNQVILCRSKNAVYAFSLSCPHQRTALRAVPGGGGFRCPKHKSRYTPDGTFIDGKATRNMDRLPITREGNQVVVDPTVLWRSDKQSAEWKGAQVVLTS
jgi:nitrite reductase/ring-hydroxylating ferredoxin subunit